jgi:hypothetical protein
MSTVSEITRAFSALYGPVNAGPGVPYGVKVSFAYVNNGVAYPANTASPPTLPGGLQTVAASVSRYSDQAQLVADSATTITGSTISYATSRPLAQQAEEARTAALASLMGAVLTQLSNAGITWPPQ